MKKMIYLIGLTFTVVVYITVGCHSGNNSTKDAQNGRKLLFSPLTSGEDTLNVSKSAIPQSTGIMYLTWGNICLSISESGTIVPLGSLAQRIDTLAFDSLYTIAHNLVSTSTGHYVTGLQFTYGMDSNYHFCIFLRPLALARTTYTPPTATYSITANSQSASNPYLKFDTITNQITSVTPAHFTYDTANFRKYIRISQSITSPVPAPFNPAQDSTGSVQSVILSFQEISAYIVHNDSVMRSRGVSYNYLHLYNSCIKYPVNIGTTKDTLIKQDIMLGLINGYEDLGHLCPPECETLKYAIQ